MAAMRGECGVGFALTSLTPTGQQWASYQWNSPNHSQIPGPYPVYMSSGPGQYRLNVVDHQGCTGTAYLTLACKKSNGFDAEREPAGLKIYPNPFKQTVNISFSLSDDNEGRLDIYNTLGQKVETLIQGTLEGGTDYKYTFDGSDLNAGLYFARLSLDDGKVITKKMTLLK